MSLFSLYGVQHYSKNPIGYYFGITITRLAFLNTFNGPIQRLNYQQQTINQLLSVLNDASFILWENVWSWSLTFMKMNKNVCRFSFSTAFQDKLAR